MTLLNATSASNRNPILERVQEASKDNKFEADKLFNDKKLILKIKLDCLPNATRLFLTYPHQIQLLKI